MKKESNSLFSLIKSLNRTEKGYFKKYCMLHGSSSKKYLQLFDCINQQNKHNEKEIARLFPKEAAGSQLSVMKTYLYKLILKTLESYQENVVFDIRSGVSQCEILYQRGLFGACKRLAKRIKKEALKYDQPIYAYEVLKLEKAILNQSGTDENTSISNINQEIRSIFRTLENHETYIGLLSKRKQILGSRATQSGGKITPDQKKALNELIHCEELSKEDHALSISSKVIFNQILSECHIHNQDHQLALPYAMRRVNLLETNPHFIRKNPFDYIIALANLAQVCSGLKKYEDALFAAEKITSIEKNHKLKLPLLRQKTLFNTSYMVATAVYSESAHFEKINSLLPGLLEGLKKFDTLMDPISKAALFYNTAFLFFGSGQYKKALEWINRTMGVLPINHPILYQARSLHLIIHYELGHYDLLPYLIKSLYKSSIKDPKEHRIELLVLRFIDKVSQTNSFNSKEKFQSILSELRKQLHSAKGYQSQIKSETQELYLIWIRSKIENKRFSEIAKQKTE